LSLKTGYPTARGVSASTKLLYGLGLNQVEVERYQVAGRELFKQTDKERSLLTTFGMEYAQAQAEGNSERMARVMQKAMMLGIDQGKVRRSAMTRQRREQGDALTRYDAQDVQDYMLDRGE
jgi:tRNA threonylcarbamoyladenosine modification (KEOPS) complex  Pcc1 subunit